MKLVISHSTIRQLEKSCEVHKRNRAGEADSGIRLTTSSSPGLQSCLVVVAEDLLDEVWATGLPPCFEVALLFTDTIMLALCTLDCVPSQPTRDIELQRIASGSALTPLIRGWIDVSFEPFSGRAK